MSEIENGTLVVMETTDGERHGEGVMVGAFNAPVYLVQTGTAIAGEPKAWLQSLCRPMTTEEQADYWRRRAIKAEQAFTQQVLAGIQGPAAVRVRGG